MSDSTLRVLVAARRIADCASKEGDFVGIQVSRPSCDHMGAVIADAVLQSGLNYSTVVRPRVKRILHTFPDMDSISSIERLIQAGQTARFLNWNHREKIDRFESLVCFLLQQDIDRVSDLYSQMNQSEFREGLQKVHGVGPKTIDYLACLVGIDSIAVDRHVRKFAKRAGIEDLDYQFLHSVFCCAADLLNLPRREFDAWVWRKESGTDQYSLVM